MKLFVVVLAGLVPLSASAPVWRGSVEAAGHGGWVRQSYGRGGGRGVWQQVTGSARATHDGAQESAMSECDHRGLTGCQHSGCWPE